MNSEPPTDTTLRFWRRSLYASIGLTVIPPLLGLGGYVYGVYQSFQKIAAAPPATTPGMGGPVPAVGSPSDLAADISISMISFAIGLGLGFLGFVFFLVCLIRFLSFRKYKHQPAAHS